MDNSPRWRGFFEINNLQFTTYFDADHRWHVRWKEKWKRKEIKKKGKEKPKTSSSSKQKGQKVRLGARRRDGNTGKHTK